MYKTQNGWTKESMKEHVKANFKGKSIDENGNCVYRGPDGKKCAVGLFIPDEFYDPMLENSAPGILDGENSLFLKKPELLFFMPFDPNGMQRFQIFHDVSKLNLKTEELLSWIDINVE